MRSAYLGCTLGLLAAFGAPAQAQSVPSVLAASRAQEMASGPGIPIPITMRADMPVLKGTYLTHRSFTATWVHVYRPLGYPTLPTQVVVSRVRNQVVAKPEFSPD